MLVTFLAFLSLIVYVVLIYCTLRSSADTAWKQLEASYSRRGLLSKRPDDRAKIHRQNQIVRTIAITIGYLAAILWAIRVLGA